MGRPDVPCSFVLFGDGECCDSCHDITIDRFAGCGINVRIPIVYDFEKRAFLGVFCIRFFFVCREFAAWFAVLRFIFRWIFVYGGIRVGLLIGTFCVVRRGFRLMFGRCFVFCCTGQLADFDFRCFGVENYLIRNKKVSRKRFVCMYAAHNLVFSVFIVLKRKDNNKRNTVLKEFVFF